LAVFIRLLLVEPNPDSHDHRQASRACASPVSSWLQARCRPAGSLARRAALVRSDHQWL